MNDNKLIYKSLRVFEKDFVYFKERADSSDLSIVTYMSAVASMIKDTRVNPMKETKSLHKRLEEVEVSLKNKQERVIKILQMHQRDFFEPMLNIIVESPSSSLLKKEVEEEREVSPATSAIPVFDEKYYQERLQKLGKDFDELNKNFQKIMDSLAENKILGGGFEYKAKITQGDKQMLDNVKRNFANKKSSNY